MKKYWKYVSSVSVVLYALSVLGLFGVLVFLVYDGSDTSPTYKCDVGCACDCEVDVTCECETSCPGVDSLPGAHIDQRVLIIAGRSVDAAKMLCGIYDGEASDWMCSASEGCSMRCIYPKGDVGL